MHAPTTTIESVTVVRPLKVIALLCLIASCALLIVSLSGTAWLKNGTFRQGLFQECVDDDPGAQQTELSDAPAIGSCDAVRDRTGTAYVHVVAALLIIAGVLTVVALVLTGVGLKTNNYSRKYLFYRAALYIGILAIVLEAASLIAFPVCFHKEIRSAAKGSRWDFDWAYGVGWGALIFTVGACVLLICDKEHEELYYKEKTIMSSNAGKEVSA